MKITRDVALKIVHEMAAELAKEFGYDQVSLNDIDCGLWDMAHLGPLGAAYSGLDQWEQGTMSKMLKDQFSEMVEYKFHAAIPEGETFKTSINKGNYVGIRYRFGEPCIAIHEHGNQYMGELELHRIMARAEDGDAILDEKGNAIFSDEYRVSELICFDEKGIEWGNRLYRMWKEKVDELEAADSAENE